MIVSPPPQARNTRICQICKSAKDGDGCDATSDKAMALARARMRQNPDAIMAKTCHREPRSLFWCSGARPSPLLLWRRQPWPRSLPIRGFEFRPQQLVAVGRRHVRQGRRQREGGVGAPDGHAQLSPSANRCVIGVDPQHLNTELNLAAP